MKNNCLKKDLRDCKHCGAESALSYYKEGVGLKVDLYYCTKCYQVHKWNGRQVEVMDFEAYPNRDK